MSKQRVWRFIINCLRHSGSINRNTTIYFINKGPSVPLEFKFIEEVWTGKELKYSYLRTFGYTVDVRVCQEKSDKLDVEVVKCYFIGYGSNMFEYMFWDDKNRKVPRHCYMSFDENICIRTKRTKILGQRSKWELRLSCGKIQLGMFLNYQRWSKWHLSTR